MSLKKLPSILRLGSGKGCCNHAGRRNVDIKNGARNAGSFIGELYV